MGFACIGVCVRVLASIRWSAIATHLPKRTDNEIKNYWNTHLKKRLTKMGIDPVTHKPKSDALVSVDGQTKNAANLSHMAQWESARLEAEARLVRESKLRSAAAAAAAATSPSSSSSLHPHLGSSSSSSAAVKTAQALPCLDVLKAWQAVWSKSNKGGIHGIIPPTSRDLDSPTSTLSFSSDNTLSIFPTSALALALAADSSKDRNSNNPTMPTTSTSMIRFINSSSPMCKEEDAEELKGQSSMFPVHDVVGLGFPVEGSRWSPEAPSKTTAGPNFTDGFTDLLMENSDDDHNHEQNASDGSDNNNSNNNDDDVNNANGSEDEDEGKNYWNSILNLVNSSPSESPLF